MECFDISHNQGAETTGSMAVFEHGRPAKSEYRKFKLVTTQGHADDFKSMAEVMQRRYGNRKDWPEPDLIVLDGGLGQLHAALPVIRNAGCNAPVIRLAKRMKSMWKAVMFLLCLIITSLRCSFFSSSAMKRTAS